jgi:hypothetical protein
VNKKNLYLPSSIDPKTRIFLFVNNSFVKTRKLPEGFGYRLAVQLFCSFFHEKAITAGTKTERARAKRSKCQKYSKIPYRL